MNLTNENEPVLDSATKRPISDLESAILEKLKREEAERDYVLDGAFFIDLDHTLLYHRYLMEAPSKPGHALPFVRYELEIIREPEPGTEFNIDFHARD